MYLIIGSAGLLLLATGVLMYQQHVNGKIGEANEKIGLPPPQKPASKIKETLEAVVEATAHEAATAPPPPRPQQGGDALESLKQKKLNQLDEIRQFVKLLS